MTKASAKLSKQQKEDLALACSFWYNLEKNKLKEKMRKLRALYKKYLTGMMR